MKKFRAVSTLACRVHGGAIGFIATNSSMTWNPSSPRPPQNELKTPVMYCLIVRPVAHVRPRSKRSLILVNAILDDAESPADAYENADG